MKYTITLHDTTTGARVEAVKNWNHSLDGLLFFWADGNGACDCNRADFFGLESPCNAGANRFEIVGIEAL